MKDLLDANIFSGFPSWKAIVYKKELTPKILQFEVTEETGVRPLYLASIISKEEKMAWQSFQDVLEHTMTLVAQNGPNTNQSQRSGDWGRPKTYQFQRSGNWGGTDYLRSKENKSQCRPDYPESKENKSRGGIRGFFGFDVLSVDIQNSIRNFDPKALSQMIMNHSKDLGPDQKALIRYGQLFALLHYRAPADWGKVEVKTHVECFSQEPAASLSTDVTEASVREALTDGPNTNQSKRSGDWGRPNYHSGKEMQSLGGGSKKKKSGGQLDLFMKKLLSESGKEPHAIYVVHDLSVNPAWDPAHEVQQQRMRAWLEKETQIRNGVSPEIYLYHSATRIPLELSRYFKALTLKPFQNTHRECVSSHDPHVV